MASDKQIAIVGMGCVFPGGKGAQGFWDLVSTGGDASEDIPAGRWPADHSKYYQPELGVADRVASRRGYFVSKAHYDTSDLPLGRDVLAGLDPLFHLTFRAGFDAWKDCPSASRHAKRGAVIIGNIVLPTEGSAKVARDYLGARFKDSLGLSGHSGSTTDPRNAFPAALPATMLAKMLGLECGGYTLDAACASSLYALKIARDELLSGRLDVVVSGGVSRPDPLYTQMGFSQLRAMSLKGRSAPFDATADGLVVGEGAGLFVMKRLEDALRDGDHIYGLLCGVGLANDIGGSLMAPNSEGQVRAMRQAYDVAGWQPSDVDYIECHATGTPLGDGVELKSLGAIWDGAAANRSCVISSVKSNVGHLLTAAGASGLARVLLALQHKTLPPTANYQSSLPKLGLEGSHFKVLKEALPWTSVSGQPRRAAISGFGFGGINAHALIEEWNPSAAPRVARSQPARRVVRREVAIVAASAQVGDLTSVELEARLFSNVKSPVSVSDGVTVPVTKFKIPPTELQEMLPQQILMLKVAAEALSQGGYDKTDKLNAGIFIGIGLDAGASRFQGRWQWSAEWESWAKSLGLEMTADEGAAWLKTLRDAYHPALNANRTMGALGGIVASRIAREFHFGGPSFTMSADELSGLRALDVAANAVARGELSMALVGAVDFAAQVEIADAWKRWQILQSVEIPASCNNGAVAFVIRPLEDAQRDGQKILAVWKCDEFKLTSSLTTDTGETSIEVKDRDVSSVFGFTGAANGLLTAWAGVKMLERRIDPNRDYWLHNRDDGVRTEKITVGTIAGDSAGLTLAEAPALTDEPMLGLGHEAYGIVTLRGDSVVEISERIREWRESVSSDMLPRDIAAEIWRRDPRASFGSFSLAIVLSGRVSFASQCELALKLLATGETRVSAWRDARRSDVFWGSGSPAGELALLFPGSGQSYVGMGRQMAAAFPGVLEARHRVSRNLGEQFHAGLFWHGLNGAPTTRDLGPSFAAQVCVASVVVDSLAQMNVKPTAAIGYSLGESSALISLGACKDRDDIFNRLKTHTLFSEWIGGQMRAVQRAWDLGPGEAVDWATCLVQQPAERIREAVKAEKRVYLQNINSDRECVLGGERTALKRVVKGLEQPWIEIPGIAAVHCEVVKYAQDLFEDFHSFDVSQPENVRFYSGASGESYHATTESAREALTAHSIYGIDLPRVIRQAYQDGVRTFVEVGPGVSLTRLVPQILGDLPHEAFSVCSRAEPELLSFYSALAKVFAAGHPVKIDYLYQNEKPATVGREPTLRVSCAAPEFNPQFNFSTPPVLPRAPQAESVRMSDVHVSGSSVSQIPQSVLGGVNIPAGLAAALARQIVATELATLDAHRIHMTASAANMEMSADLISRQMRQVPGVEYAVAPVLGAPVEPVPPSLRQPAAHEKPLFDFDACQEFARGSIAKVLGPKFASIDAHPTRVRLPDGPLLLCHRIMAMEAEPGSMTSGRLITEHDVVSDAWYLDQGKIPTAVAVESGQADLFLSAVLGIDFKTKGKAVYRLLDAVVTFHQALPVVGDTIRYDIRIHNFFNQGETTLFRFSFEATVNGEPLMSMAQGVAGFFTEQELALGKGVIKTALDLRPMPGKITGDFVRPVTDMPAVMSDRQVDALREGDYAAAFGERFAGLAITNPTCLPGGMMRLVHRVKSMSSTGGQFGLGQIRGEADIHPDDWFLTCHFVDDKVMPGTLMYECCMHTLRVYLLAMGWVGEAEDLVAEPIPGLASQLKCRGQVLQTTKKVTYEITPKEIGYRPEAYVICDALMFADGKPIVEIPNMTLHFAGYTKEKCDAVWAGKIQSETPVLFGPAEIDAYAQGKPSEAFGEPYKIFDGEERKLARLPRAPYQFMDRVLSSTAEPFKMVAGGTLVGAYDVPPDAWYFKAENTNTMPFAILLEVALQPCGFFAAYVGSALCSDVDIKFRNLGGKAVQHRVVTPDSGTLITTITMTKVNQSGGMIIQDYALSMRDGNGNLVYEGTTVFGFFSKEALSQQVGVRGAKLPTGASLSEMLPYPDGPSYPVAPILMVDGIEAFDPTGGDYGLGYLRGLKRVNPKEWFFDAHFYQDPVMPGSLGLEAFIQVLKVAATERWGSGACQKLESLAVGNEHEWIYRGQLIPANKEMRVDVSVKSYDDSKCQIVADGYLSVDGKCVYQIKNFALKFG